MKKAWAEHPKHDTNIIELYHYMKNNMYLLCLCWNETAINTLQSKN